MREGGGETGERDEHEGVGDGGLTGARFSVFLIVEEEGRDGGEGKQEADLQGGGRGGFKQSKLRTFPWLLGFRERNLFYKFLIYRNLYPSKYYKSSNSAH